MEGIASTAGQTNDRNLLRRVGLTLLIVIGCFPAALMWHYVTRNWISIPFWDEWFTPGNQFASWCRGTLTLQELFSQHNESRKFFPRILYLALAKLGGWDVRKEMTVLFLTVCLLGGLLFRLLRRTPGASTVSALTAWAVMMFLCFSPVQFENFLWGIQLEAFFPGIALAAIAVVNLSGLSFRTKSLANLLLAFAATYTYANGIILWPLGLPLSSREVPSRTRITWYGVYLVSALVAVGCYFIGYDRPDTHPAWASVQANYSDIAHYVVLWIGAYFRSDQISAVAAGLVALTLFFGVFALSIAFNWRDRRWKASYPWLIIGIYAVATCAVITIGRVGFGVKQALDSRYTTFSLFFYLTLVGAIFAFYCSYVRTASAGWRDLFLIASGGMIGLALLGWMTCYRHGVVELGFHREYRVKLKRALEWMGPIPDNPDLSLIFPHVDWLRNSARILAEHRILRLPFVGEPLSSSVKQRPDAVDSSSGEIETCLIDSKHDIFITGWAWLPAERRRADCVVIGFEDGTGAFKPVSVLETGTPRDDLRSRTQQPNIYRAGFSRTINPANMPSGEVKISGWAVDLIHQEVWPLGGRKSLRLRE